MLVISLIAFVMAAVVSDLTPTRARRLLAKTPVPQVRQPRSSEAGLGKLLPGFMVVVVSVLIMPGPTGWVVGAVGSAVLAVRISRRGAATAEGSEAGGQAVELLAACLAAGATPVAAIAAVANVSDTEIKAVLEAVGGALRLGADVELAWRPAREVPSLRGLALAAARSADTGAPLAELLFEAAADARADQLARSKAAVQRAGIKIVLPVGLCFLPAFILVGVVPVIVSMLGTVLQ